MNQDHAHSHDAEHEHHHPHPRQPDVEDAPLSWHMALTEAVADLMVAKGLCTTADIHRTLEVIDAASPAAGARLVARAWLDPVFRELMLADVNRAASDLGIDAGAIPIRAVENRPDLHNVIVCTLCSCYPRFLLGGSPDWYKSKAYRSRMVREPRAVLREFGVDLPADVRVDVHDSTAELRYMVIPNRPVGTEGWSEERLAETVTRDAMIGTGLARCV
ncbi:MAG TPA: nitrile hydratase subunit alpha [Geminicoccus sp.]|jgi:nitrile hydratase|uniref:nitrile hydratase subunit alpha n=1 Tax=Geminicoccus sp. TaxID=2024832 RepID=UPI002E36BA05|nr:nitrile hydratase subunit alpha [Geminicoccus sp.]HEX2525339.1 nitrile hydratase subunit alpha [Geminicoccus sp.]